MHLVDTHVHIDYYKNYKQIYDKYNDLKIYTLFVTNLPEIYQECSLTFMDSKYVKIALGYNPQMVKDYSFNRILFNKFFSSTKYIGEVGLDFSNKFVKFKKEQLDVFNYICKCVSNKQKIISIHSRNSEKIILDVLINNGIKFAIFHWYSGSLNFIEEIVKNGYYFSINNAMLYSKKGREIINKIPLNKILIESDGPFTKFNKKIFKPDYLASFYKKLEEFYGIDNLRSIVFNNLNQLLSSYNSYLNIN